MLKKKFSINSKKYLNINKMYMNAQEVQKTHV